MAQAPETEAHTENIVSAASETAAAAAPAPTVPSASAVVPGVPAAPAAAPPAAVVASPPSGGPVDYTVDTLFGKKDATPPIKPALLAEQVKAVKAIADKYGKPPAEFKQLFVDIFNAPQIKAQENRYQWALWSIEAQFVAETMRAVNKAKVLVIGLGNVNEKKAKDGFIQRVAARVHYLDDNTPQEPVSLTLVLQGKDAKSIPKVELGHGYETFIQAPGSEGGVATVFVDEKTKFTPVDLSQDVAFKDAKKHFVTSIPAIPLKDAIEVEDANKKIAIEGWLIIAGTKAGKNGGPSYGWGRVYDPSLNDAQRHALGGGVFCNFDAATGSAPTPCYVRMVGSIRKRKNPDNTIGITFWADLAHVELNLKAGGSTAPPQPTAALVDTSAAEGW